MFQSTPGKLIFIGLDNAGKTSLLGVLKSNHVKAHLPNQLILQACESFKVGNSELNAYDLGGHLQARRVWKDYFPAVDGIVFLIDASDQEKLPVAKNELLNVIEEKETSDLPILILANKIDKPEALGMEYLTDYLEIRRHLTSRESKKQPGEERPIQIFFCSVHQRQGYGEGLRWLLARINN